ncbi:MAG: hypothetical protein AB7O97_13010 [Planctomycetota bacterium]
MSISRTCLVLTPVLLGATAPAQWTGERLLHSPALTNFATAAFDHTSQQVMAFGGYNSASQPTNTTWRYDGALWSSAIVPGSPPPRAHAQMAANAARGIVVLFGGQGSVFGPLLDDTWEWNGTTWQQRITSTTPGPRIDGAMAYDLLRDRVVLFGGRVSFSSMTDETWEYDGQNWTLQSVSAAPLARYAAAMAYDIARGQMVLYGGTTQAGIEQSDTWTYNGAQWQLVPNSPAPGPRHAAQMVYDWRAGRCRLFGGYGASSIQTHEDAFEFDGATWTQTPGPYPPGRTEHAMAYDPVRDQTLLFGGRRFFATLDSTWTYGPRSVPFAFGCPGGNGVPLLTTSVPRVGTTTTVALQQLLPAATSALLVFGFTELDRSRLDAFGLPGCSLYSTVDRIDAMPAAGGAAAHAFAVPPDPALAGFGLVLTGVSFDPINPFGAVLSAPQRVVIGR